MIGLVNLVKPSFSAEKRQNLLWASVRIDIDERDDWVCSPVVFENISVSKAWFKLDD